MFWKFVQNKLPSGNLGYLAIQIKSREMSRENDLCEMSAIFEDADEVSRRKAGKKKEPEHPDSRPKPINTFMRL